MKEKKTNIKTEIVVTNMNISIAMKLPRKILLPTRKNLSELQEFFVIQRDKPHRRQCDYPYYDDCQRLLSWAIACQAKLDSYQMAFGSGRKYIEFEFSFSEFVYACKFVMELGYYEEIAELF